MMHDDSYPPDYVTGLVECLEKCPDAVLAYGGLVALYENGTQKMQRPDPSFAGAKGWNLREIFRRFLAEHLLLAVRGIYRREMALQRGIFILPTRDLIAADFLWIMATAFVGRWICVPDILVTKRYYPTSALAYWKSHTAKHTISELAALEKYLVASAPGFREKARGCVAVVFWAILRFGGDFLFWIGMHARWHSRLHRVLDRVLRGR